MAFTYRNSSVYDSSNSPSTYTLAVPTGLTAGDILFCLRMHSSNSARTYTDTWTRLGQMRSTQWYEIFYCIYNGSTPTGITFTTYVSGVRSKSTIIAYYGDSYTTTNPIQEVSNTQYITSNNILRAGSVTIAENKTPIIFIGGKYGTTVTFTPPTGYTEDYDGGTVNSDMYQTFDSILFGSTGPTGTVDATISAAVSTKHAFLVSLNKPAPPPRQRIRITHM